MNDTATLHEPSTDSALDDIADDTSSHLHAWERVSYTTVRLVMAGALKVLGLSGVYRFGRAFGFLEWCINYKRRRRFSRAMDRVFQDSQDAAHRRRLCRSYFMDSRCDKLFELILDCLSRERAMSLFSVEPKELLDDAFCDGKGVYLAMAHHGTHHIGTVLLSLLGYKVAGVRDGSESGLRRYVQQRYRRRFPEYQNTRMFFTDTWPRKIYRCLKSGYILGSAIDVSRKRNANQSTETVTMFGEQRTFLTGPIRIAISAGVPVLQAFVLPCGQFRYTLKLHGPLLRPGVSRHDEQAIVDAVHQYAHTVENIVRQHPTHISRI